MVLFRRSVERIISEGGVAIFDFTDLANFWFGFSVFALKNFGFGVSCSLLIFSNLAFGFRFLSTMMAVFRPFFCPIHFTVFLVSPRKCSLSVKL